MDAPKAFIMPTVGGHQQFHLHLKLMVDGVQENALHRTASLRVKAFGGGIESVNFEVTRLVSHPVRLRIPAGTFCVSGSPSAQNMVLTADAEHTVDSTSISFSVAAACANIAKDVPTSEIEFKLEQRPRDRDLARLVSLMARKDEPYAVKQAAVWIVADDATTSQMRRLVVERRTFRAGDPLGAFRPPNQQEEVIGEYDISQALALCREAGIEPAQTAVWNERAQSTYNTWRTSELLRQLR